MTQPYGSHSQGVHGDGARSFTPQQACTLLEILKNECQGPSNKMTVEELAVRAGMPGKGRAVRDAISELEKAKLVLTDFSEGYYVCATVEQAERGTRRLTSQIKSMQPRVEARAWMTARLVKMQEGLF